MYILGLFIASMYFVVTSAWKMFLLLTGISDGLTGAIVGWLTLLMAFVGLYLIL